MNANDICMPGKALAENNEFIISRYGEEDKQVYLDLLMENQATLETYKEDLWQGTLQDPKMFCCKIFSKALSLPIGELSIMGIDTETPELGIELFERFRNQGYGTKVFGVFLEKLSSVFWSDYFMVRIRSNNEASKRLAYKFGAIEIGTEGDEIAQIMKRLLSEKGTEQFEKIIGQSADKVIAHTICYKIPAKRKMEVE